MLNEQLTLERYPWERNVHIILYSIFAYVSIHPHPMPIALYLIPGIPKLPTESIDLRIINNYIL